MKILLTIVLTIVFNLNAKDLYPMVNKNSMKFGYVSYTSINQPILPPEFKSTVTTLLNKQTLQNTGQKTLSSNVVYNTSNTSDTINRINLK
jgi:hypothetical protein